MNPLKKYPNATKVEKIFLWAVLLIEGAMLIYFGFQSIATLQHGGEEFNLLMPAVLVFWWFLTLWQIVVLGMIIEGQIKTARVMLMVNLILGLLGIAFYIVGVLDSYSNFGGADAFNVPWGILVFILLSAIFGIVPLLLFDSIIKKQKVLTIKE